ncbi:PREDICTED: HRAS-like suppressor 3 [Sturnus vulgaris]|uniref:HRAS-like suppressor 3 n=1 Tax=Sturnus vulgaris TaxID=9172 RepID=UPI00071A523D|nr:PREDICTED: HRAS-like suppressor 3 [Sturnus vulgaris]
MEEEGTDGTAPRQCRQRSRQDRCKRHLPVIYSGSSEPGARLRQQRGRRRVSQKYTKFITESLLCVFQLKAFVGGELHILDMRDDKDYPIPGDLIEIDRPLYQHWALYVGNGYVIHVTPVGENSPPMSAGSVTLLMKKAKVKKELLEKAAENDNWRVNNKYDHYRNPFPVEEIIRRAERQIGRIVLYRLFYKNCEHFVTELRYGEAVSEQAVTALQKIRSVLAPVMAGVGTAGLSVVAGLTFPAALPFVAANGLALFSTISARYISDTFLFDKFMKAKAYILEQRCC